MVLLQSYDRFGELAELDLDTGRLTWFARSCVEASPFIRGHVARVSGHTLCLYRQAGALHLRIDNNDWELDEETEADLTHLQEGTNQLTGLRRGAPLFSWQYRRPSIMPFQIELTPGAEEEHFDFGLFVYNVLSDPGRRKRIYTEQSR